MSEIERIPYNGPAYNKVIINNPLELKELLNKFCQELVNKLPAGHGVNLQRNGPRSFNCQIAKQHPNGFVVEQEFHIEWDLHNQVNWRPYYGN
ncbi:hypothetical protein JC221_17 [Yersinia phage JC221]|nr:hypothetical protein JC221_17 [Yersinia phage JC221]